MASGNRKVTVTYYGMLAEKLNINSEELELPSGEINLRKFFVNKHPELKSFTFSAAVDLEYIDTLTEQALPQKIDLMPPFAGG
ncbi:hypothetical protein OAK35_00095 [Crocinitomicaceae bacterium]|nr:hypothetical protein [Crocinitomicaceae bacterium]MDC0257118.1 hypothetical protein [Crocinitomicaceae bacterium]